MVMLLNLALGKRNAKRAQRDANTIGADPGSQQQGRQQKSQVLAVAVFLGQRFVREKPCIRTAICFFRRLLIAQRADKLGDFVCPKIEAPDPM